MKPHITALMRVRSARVFAGVVLFGLSGCWSYISPEARQRFEAQRGPISVTVYPVNVACGGKPTVGDAALGRELVDWLNAEKIANARLGRPGAPIAVKWVMNQAKMAEQSARAFGAWVQQANIETDYALLVEILCNRDETEVMGVHFYLAEKSGLLAAGGLTNSHWSEFKRIKPVDRAGGLRVLEAMIEKRWRDRNRPDTAR